MIEKEKTISSADRTFMEPILHGKLKTVKAVEPHPAHAHAVAVYKKQLVKLLKKVNPRGSYYEW
jgi:hypothetical protein